MPQFAPPAGTVQLEAGTGLLLLARIMDGGIERLRVLNDDCPIDAGTAAVVWLPDVTPAESLRVLDDLTRDGRASATDGSRRVAKTAVTAIGRHRDPAAEAILDRLAQSADGPVWPQAVQSLATARGAHGFHVVATLLDAARERSARRTLASALGQTRQPETAARLLALARTDTDPAFRGDALYWYVQRAGATGIPDVMSLLASEKDAGVERRAVSAIATLPAAASVPLLITLAGPRASLTVRKAAVSALGRSNDARATAFLEDLVAR
jgi:HEAT repeat protein